MTVAQTDPLIGQHPRDQRSAEQTATQRSAPVDNTRAVFAAEFFYGLIDRLVFRLGEVTSFGNGLTFPTQITKCGKDFRCIRHTKFSHAKKGVVPSNRAAPECPPSAGRCTKSRPESPVSHDEWLALCERIHAGCQEIGEVGPWDGRDPQAMSELVVGEVYFETLGGGDPVREVLIGGP